MMIVIRNFDNDDYKFAFNSNRISKIVEGATVQGLSTTTAPTITKRGSGYSDDEIEQSATDLIASISGSTNAKGHEISLLFGLGIAGAAPKAMKKGRFKGQPTAAPVVTVSGYDEKVAPVLAASFTKIENPDIFELTSISVTEPGILIPENGAKSIIISIERLSTDDEETDPEIEVTLSNFLYKAQILKRGGGFTSGVKTVTLDAPAKKAGSITKAAATFTVPAVSFKKPSVSVHGQSSAVVPNHEIKAFIGELVELNRGNKNLTDPPGLIRELY